MNRRRTLINMVAFLVVSGLLLYLGTTQFLFPPAEGRRLTMTVSDAAGLLPRNDVTVRGVPAGAVKEVHLNGDGTAEVALQLNPGVEVTQGTIAEITRRSPIGDITVNLVPGDGPPFPNGGHIPMEDTVIPPDPVETIAVLTNMLSALTPEDVETLVTELSTALRGRGGDLASLSESGANLPERILEVRVQLESLMTRGPDLLDVLVENRRVLADDLTQTALLADILRDRRFDLVELMRNGADFAEVLGALLADDKANLSCLVNDFADINDVLADAENLQNLREVLDLNHFFFGAVDQIVQPSPSDDLDWFRVHFLEPQEAHANRYAQRRPPNDVYGGNSCRSRFGPGVGPGHQPHDPYIAPGSRFHPGS
jgi:phospholipid/cholesterol/gamma-HCH transport system substrate-binding protein